MGTVASPEVSGDSFWLFERDTYSQGSVLIRGRNGRGLGKASPDFGLSGSTSLLGVLLFVDDGYRDLGSGRRGNSDSLRGLKSATPLAEENF